MPDLFQEIESILIPALPLWQPFAQLMADGLKDVETRNRHTYVRGEFVVCATKKIAPPDLYKGLLRRLRERGVDPWPYFPEQLRTGVALAKVNLIHSRAMEERDVPGAFVDVYSEPGKRRWAWVTDPRERRKFERPFEVRCGQGWFRVTRDQVREALLAP